MPHVAQRGDRPQIVGLLLRFEHLFQCPCLECLGESVSALDVNTSRKPLASLNRVYDREGPGAGKHRGPLDV